MKRFSIRAAFFSTGERTYEVDAESGEEAIKKCRDGQVEVKEESLQADDIDFDDCEVTELGEPDVAAVEEIEDGE